MKEKLFIKKVFAVFVFVVGVVLFTTQTPKAFAASLTSDNVLNEVNQVRIQNGVPALKKNNQLALAAERKGQNMITYAYWAHTNPTTGATPWSFILGTGYRKRYLGENLARNYNDTTPLLSAWMNSPTHKANLIASKYKETGIAVVTGTVNGQEWTVVIEEFGGN